MEDVGLGAFDLVGQVVSALGNKRWHLDQGGELRVASQLVQRMCGAVKDRSGDDLIVDLEYDPQIQMSREQAADLLLGYRLGASVDEGLFLKSRALASWLAVGTRRVRSPQIAEVEGDPDAYFQTLADAGYPPAAVELSREVLRKTGTALTIMLPHPQMAVAGQPTGVMPDEGPWRFTTFIRSARSVRGFGRYQC